MTDAFAFDSPTNAVEYTVSEISGSIRRTVEDAFGHVRVRGEISGYRGAHASGHAYFALKDDKARIEAVIWRGAFSRLKVRPEEGMEVIATGKITTYPGSSKYQIVIESLEPAGAGALMALIEERRRRLAAEGLFEAGRKRALPFMPKVVGVVTSPTGAVIRDILHRIADRFPVHVVVWPVRVQGETCGPEVSAAIAGFNALEPGGPVARPDVLIVARGGGSLEDLWGFNDEAVVRAAAASDIPLISAVGHETDWTLIDHAADRRAPTPTAAAEIAVPVKAELEATLASLAARLSAAMSRLADRKRESLRNLARLLPSLDTLLADPRRRFDDAGQRLDRAIDGQLALRQRALERAAARLTPQALSASIRERRQLISARAATVERLLERAGERRRHALSRSSLGLAGAPARLETRIARERERLAVALARAERAADLGFERGRRRVETAKRLLGSLSHENVLKRGFAIVRDAADRPLTAAAGIADGARLSIQFADGRIAATAGSATGPLDPEGSMRTGAAQVRETAEAAKKPRPRGKDQPKETGADPQNARASRSRDGTGGSQGSLF